MNLLLGIHSLYRLKTKFRLQNRFSKYNPQTLGVTIFLVLNHKSGIVISNWIYVFGILMT